MNAEVDGWARQSPSDGNADAACPGGRASFGAQPAACDAPIIDGPAGHLVSHLETTGLPVDAALCLVRGEAREARASGGPGAMRRRARCRHAAAGPDPMHRRKPCGDPAARLVTASRDRAADAR
jgi:hypothetical protein